MKSDQNKPTIDIPPPISEATRHPVYPDIKHDDRARFNFLAAANKVIASTLAPANQLAYEQDVLPEFEQQHGRTPNNRHEIRKGMNRHPFHRLWSATRRNLMEMRQQTGRSLVLRQIDELAHRANELNKDSENLQLDPSVDIPSYVSIVDHHCMPGSYYTELIKDDVAPAANYDAGFFITTGGTNGSLCDAPGKAIAGWMSSEHSGFRPERILDIGVGAGHNLVAIAQAFPDTEIIGIDVSATMLRYGHARAKSLGVDNIRFIQMSGEDLSAFEDSSFDWVMTSVFLHELSSKALPKILTESFRVLKQGGINLHLEQPLYDDSMPLFEQFMRDWDAFNNNEPFWSAMHSTDMDALMTSIGYDQSEIFYKRIQAVTEDEVFPASSLGTDQEYGRGSSWQVYGAWKTDNRSEK